jgi:DnaJ-class molecular chaperone
MKGPKRKPLDIAKLADCDDCKGAGGAPIHPEQPCPSCGWDVFQASLVEDAVAQLRRNRIDAT